MQRLKHGAHEWGFELRAVDCRYVNVVTGVITCNAQAPSINRSTSIGKSRRLQATLSFLVICMLLETITVATCTAVFGFFQLWSSGGCVNGTRPRSPPFSVQYSDIIPIIRVCAAEGVLTDYVFAVLATPDSRSSQFHVSSCDCLFTRSLSV
jgi:hypothetical protein